MNITHTCYGYTHKIMDTHFLKQLAWTNLHSGLEHVERQRERCSRKARHGGRSQFYRQPRVVRVGFPEHLCGQIEIRLPCHWHQNITTSTCCVEITISSWHISRSCVEIITSWHKQHRILKEHKLFRPCFHQVRMTTSMFKRHFTIKNGEFAIHPIFVVTHFLGLELSRSTTISFFSKTAVAKNDQNGPQSRFMEQTSWS